MLQTVALTAAPCFSPSQRSSYSSGGTPFLSSTVFLLPEPRNNRCSVSAQCVRIGGVVLPEHKRIEISLQRIYGIGRSLSKTILNNLNMVNKHTRDLTPKEIAGIRKEVSKYRTEGDLRRFNANCIKRLIDIKCYRGIRHLHGLPCRGQCTRRNCQTNKRRRIAARAAAAEAERRARESEAKRAQNAQKSSRKSVRRSK